MTRRVAGLVGLTAVAIATVLVIALTADRTTSSTATTTELSTPISSTAPTEEPRASKAQRRSVRRTARRSAAKKLLDQHDCWVGEAPAGAAPTHAVVTLPGAEPALVAADVGFGIWLEGEPGVLHGFCP